MSKLRIHEFTDLGQEYFEKAFSGQIDEDVLKQTSPEFATPLHGAGTVEIDGFTRAKDMAMAITIALGGADKVRELQSNKALWSWLTFVLRDTVLPRNSSGLREFKEVHRWLPSDPGDWQKAQRHLVRMPTLLYATLGDDADHLLWSAPHLGPEVKEQLTSQQDMFHLAFQRAAKMLYFDSKKMQLKKGHGSKSGGTPRRLAAARKKLDVTWDLFELSAEQIYDLLPKEFDRFKDIAARSKDP